MALSLKAFYLPKGNTKACLPKCIFSFPRFEAYDLDASIHQEVRNQVHALEIINTQQDHTERGQGQQVSCSMAP